MVAVNQLRLELIEVVADQPRLRNLHRKIAAVEMLNGRNAEDELRRFLGAFKLRRDHPHVVPATTELLFVGADAAGHAPHMRKIRVGEHDDSQRAILLRSDGH
jgi:hypothetical protein